MKDWLWLGFWAVVSLILLAVFVLLASGISVFFWPGEVRP